MVNYDGQRKVMTLQS